MKRVFIIILSVLIASATSYRNKYHLRVSIYINPRHLNRIKNSN